MADWWPARTRLDCATMRTIRKHHTVRVTTPLPSGVLPTRSRSWHTGHGHDCIDLSDHAVPAAGVRWIPGLIGRAVVDRARRVVMGRR